MSFLIIISAVVIALVLFAFLATASNRNDVSASIINDVDWSAIADDELQSYLPNRKINAIKRYRDLTGYGLKESKLAIEYVIAHPDSKKGKRYLSHIPDGAGIRDLVEEGRIEEAIKVYAAFMGVDEFTARDVIQDMQRESVALHNLSDVDLSEIRRFASQGKKLTAVQLYAELTGVSLSDAKQFVEEEL